MPKNKYKVNKRQWRRWGPEARDVFNRLYATMKQNQSLFQATGADVVLKRHWKVTAWNAAWMAADFAEEARGEA